MTFDLPPLANETVAELKERVSPMARQHPCFFVLRAGPRPLKLIESVAALLGDDGATFDVVWTTCSHGAPAHPITGESYCFYDGASPSSVEY